MFGLEGERLRKVELGIRTGYPGVSIMKYCHTLKNDLEGERLRKVEFGIRTGHPGVSTMKYCHTPKKKKKKKKKMIWRVKGQEK